MDENPAASAEAGPGTESGPPPQYGPAPGTPPPPTPGTPPGHSGADSFFDGIRRSGLVRSDERWIGGVGGGVALRLGIDPLVVRGLLGASVLLGGLGLVLYGLAWVLLPEQRDGRIHLQQLFRGDFDVAVLAALAVFVSGVSFPDSWVPGLWWAGDGGWWNGLLWLSAVIVVVVLVAGSNRQRGVPPTPPRAGAQPHRPDGPTTTLYPGQGGPLGPSGPLGPGEPVGPSGPAGPGDPVDPSGPVTAIPRPPATPGPGGTAVGVVVALTLLTFAGLLYADRSDRFDGPVLLVTGAAALVLAGVGIIVSGLRGRSSGALGGLCVIAITALVPLAAVHQANWDWDAGGTAFGDVVERPQTVAAAERGYTLGAGNARIDLTGLPLGDEPVQVPVRVGAGDVRVVMPADGAYSGQVQVFVGEVEWLGQSVSRGGGSPSTYESPAVADGAEPDLVLEITVGAGRVTVVEE